MQISNPISFLGYLQHIYFLIPLTFFHSIYYTPTPSYILSQFSKTFTTLLFNIPLFFPKYIVHRPSKNFLIHFSSSPLGVNNKGVGNVHPEIFVFSILCECSLSRRISYSRCDELSGTTVEGGGHNFRYKNHLPMDKEETEKLNTVTAAIRANGYVTAY